MDGLIIKKKWLDAIFQGKNMEVRGSDTKKRRRIALIESGSGKIIGDTFLSHTYKIRSNQHFKLLYPCHRVIGGFENLGYTTVWVWVLMGTFKYPEPIPYKHPQGAVIWVKNVL